MHGCPSSDSTNINILLKKKKINTLSHAMYSITHSPELIPLCLSGSLVAAILKCGEYYTPGLLDFWLTTSYCNLRSFTRERLLPV